MREKIGKDTKNAKNNRRLILITGILALTVAILYLISILVGDAFRDFCEGAIEWVLMGIGVASGTAYISQKE